MIQNRGYLVELKYSPTRKGKSASKSPFPEEKEIAIPGGINAHNILGATPVNADGSYVGYTILNPKVYLK